MNCHNYKSIDSQIKARQDTYLVLLFVVCYQNMNLFAYTDSQIKARYECMTTGVQVMGEGYHEIYKV